MLIETVEAGVSTCPSTGPKGELVEMTFDCAVAVWSLQGKIQNSEVVEDFESRPHEAVTFRYERDTESQDVRELNMPEALPGLSEG